MRALASTLQLAHRRRVGTTHVDVRVSNPADPSRGFEQRLIVDSGAVFTIVPAPLLRAIGIEPDRVQRFELADGRVVTREVLGLTIDPLRRTLRAMRPMLLSLGARGIRFAGTAAP